MTQTSRFLSYRRMAAAIFAVLAATSGITAQAEGPPRGGHDRPAYYGGYRDGHAGYRGVHDEHRRDNDRGGGSALVGALLGAVVGAALVGATQPPPPVVYSAPPPPPPPGVEYYPDSYPPGY
jgi:hypothetical protein